METRILDVCLIILFLNMQIYYALKPFPTYHTDRSRNIRQYMGRPECGAEKILIQCILL